MGLAASQGIETSKFTHETVFIIIDEFNTQALGGKLMQNIYQSITNEVASAIEFNVKMGSKIKKIHNQPVGITPYARKEIAGGTTAAARHRPKCLKWC